MSRRAIAKGAAWSVPTVLLAGTAPALAVSQQDCEVVLDTDASADRSYTKNSTTQGFYTWQQPFGPGSGTLRLDVDAVRTFGTGALHRNNLNHNEQTVSGTGRTGLNLSINPGNINQCGELVTFRFSYDGAPIVVTPTSTIILCDIDAGASQVDNTGVDRMWVQDPVPESEVSNPQYIGGSGTPGFPWRRRGRSRPTTVNINNFTDSTGNVRLNYGPVSSFSIGYSTARPTPTSNFGFTVYVSSFQFRALNPLCS